MTDCVLRDMATKILKRIGLSRGPRYRQVWLCSWKRCVSLKRLCGEECTWTASAAVHYSFDIYCSNFHVIQMSVLSEFFAVKWSLLYQCDMLASRARLVGFLMLRLNIIRLARDISSFSQLLVRVIENLTHNSICFLSQCLCFSSTLWTSS